MSRPAISDQSPASADGDEHAARCAQLVELTRENPEAGLAELHRRYSATVNRLVWRLLGADPDHDDLVQQVFFAMLTSLRQLRDPTRLDFWVRTVTVNAVRQELRKRSVRRFFFRESSHTRRVGDLVDEVESRNLLAQCVGVLDKIPTDQRLVFVLHLVEGHSLRDVAEMCGYSHITAKRRLKAATKRFRTLVQTRPDLLKRLGALAASSETDEDDGDPDDE
jgi:RNA polymerase sigma-70 factor, ECF subfamily